VDYHIEKLKELFNQWAGCLPDNITAIPPSGSDRRYYRLGTKNKCAIGAWNPIKEENKAFLYFSRHFLNNGLHVPEIYAGNPEQNIYLIEDLGNVSLFNLLENANRESLLPVEIEKLYKESLKELVRFQVVAGKTLDYSYCYPYHSFDARSMKWDLQYFKYYFLKLHIPFHEGSLEEDFDTLIHFLGQAGSHFFMYRDFQSRNIMVIENQPYFIDYQGGRKGPLQYDVASLLFQVKADLPFDMREELLEFYISELGSHVHIDHDDFKTFYYGFVLIRLLQVLGAYGYRGLIEKKPHFLSSIPYALRNLQWFLSHINLPLNMPELMPALTKLTGLKKYDEVHSLSGTAHLTISIKSFSYKTGIPEDTNGNGGGFVFDCRALPNPGREEKYREFNGKDQVIIDYLKNEPEVIDFLQETENLVSRSVENYLERGFGNLAVNYGCTGGQHRSVYCAETMAERLRRRFLHVIVNVEHVMLNE